MRRMIDAFAEYERLIIGARTKAALQAKIRRNERVGKVRFGYDLAPDGATLIQNDGEQSVIAVIRQLHQSGNSLRRIAAELSRQQIITKQGNTRWTHTAVARILSRVNGCKKQTA